MAFYCNPQINLSMNLYLFPNDDFVVVYGICRISLLDMKLIVCLKKSPLCLFEIAFTDIWIFLTPSAFFKKNEFLFIKISIFL